MNDDVLLGLGEQARRAQDAQLAMRPLPPLVVSGRARRRTSALGIFLPAAAGFAACALLVVVLGRDGADGGPVEVSGTAPRGQPGNAQGDATAPSIAATAPSLNAPRDPLLFALEGGSFTFTAPPAVGGVERWVVRAGERTIEVAPGTRATVRWDAKANALAIHVDSGEAHVGGRVIHAGGSLEDTIGTAKPSATNAPVTAPTAAAPDAGPADDVEAPTVPVPATWQDLARAGRHTEALTAARTLGIQPIFDEASAADLLLLGNTARFALDNVVATTAFEAARERFPGTLEAARASFFLARIATDVKRDDTKAIVLLREYLAAAPSDVYRQEATGRLVETLMHSGRGDEARDPARAYLQAFPGGPHAELCKTLLGTTR